MSQESEVPAETEAQTEAQMANAALQKQQPAPALSGSLTRAGGAEHGLVEITIHRPGMEDRLGLDLRYCKTYLIVKAVQENEAADMHNQRNASNGQMRIEVGDVIMRVNDVEGYDVAMIQECRRTQAVTFLLRKSGNGRH